MLNTQPFAATNQANFKALMGLTAKAFDGVERLTALNMQVIKASLDEASETGLAALSAPDAQALFALQAGWLQPSADKASAYGRQVVDIFDGVKAEVEKLIAEQTAAAQSSFIAAIEAASKDAPEGASQGLALLKSAIVTANGALDSLQQASRQVAQAAESNVVALTRPTAKPAAKAKRA